LSNENQPRLLSFTLDGWDVLGGRVSVSLSDRVAVLVGRNGAGKSAILEGFETISSCAGIGFPNKTNYGGIGEFPRILNIEILTPHNRLLQYHYELKYSQQFIFDNPGLSWDDRGQYVDEAKELLWMTIDGVTTIFDKTNDSSIFGVTSLFERYRGSNETSQSLTNEMQWIHSVLRGISLIGKTPIRSQLKRHESLLRMKKNGHTSQEIVDLSDSLSRRIIRLKDVNELEELENIIRRIGLGDKVTIQKFVLNEKSYDEDQEYFSSVLLDGVNIGFLSDGTLRILSILIDIITDRPSSTTIIEEPEQQVHPGLLEKLLNEIETYTFGDNLIISTHSPQVVSWAKPNKIDLIYRDNGKISVRKLSENEIHRAIEYLNKDGDLGDWIYSGILDD
jgi:hypothetical protein